MKKIFDMIIHPDFNAIKHYFKHFNLKKELLKGYKKIRTFERQLRSGFKRYIKTNILFSVFIGSSLFNSTLLRFYTVKNYFFMKPIIADLAFLLIIGSFGYFIKPKNQFKYFMFWSVIFTTLCVINSMYYTNYLSFASVSLISTSLQIVDVGDAVIHNVMELKDFSYIWQVAAMIYTHYILNKKKYYDIAGKIEAGKVRAVNTMIAGLILVAIYISSMTSIDVSRLAKQWNRASVLNNVGLYTYQVNDLLLTVRSKISPLFGYDKNAKLFREYYATKVDTSKKNQYTDIFKGKNVIVIHAESIQNFVINTSFNDIPVSPTLNKLAKEGIYFNNFYAQDSIGTSSDTEFTFNTSLLPTSSGTVFINYFDREYVSTEKLLKEQGYYTFSMHGNNGSFWNRKIMHADLGYDRMYSYPDDYVLDDKIGLGLSDESFFRQSIPYIKDVAANNANFYGTLIMLSNHTPFSGAASVSSYEVNYKYQKYNELTKQNEEVISPFLENTLLGRYFKSVNYADTQLGVFLDNMDKEGLLENTVVLLYGDHDAKIRKSEFEYYYNYDPMTDSVKNKNDPNYREVTNYDYELNRTVPFIIWTKNKAYKKTVSKVMGMYDALPTIGNMFGFKNPYALGNDIFSIDENVVIFPNGNWVTNKMYYDVQKEEGFTLNPGDVVSVDYIENYNKKAESIIDVSNSIIIYDMIKKSKEENLLLIQESGD